MGCGASKADLSGETATVGFFGKKKKMPPGVSAQWMPKGIKPGAVFLKTPSAAVDAKCAEKGVDWAAFKQDVADTCGGGDVTGWSTEKIAALLDDKYNPMWKEKGIEVFICYVIKHTDKSAESFYWLEVKDLAVADAAYVPEEKVSKK